MSDWAAAGSDAAKRRAVAERFVREYMTLVKRAIEDPPPWGGGPTE
jgi:hypothetical protein